MGEMMFENKGHYCCDNFDFARIQFKVAIQQAKENTGKVTGNVGVEQKSKGDAK
jgi:hypothetical protein